MKCLKCGTAITSDQIFCESCRDDMDKHPVNPGTPVMLPQRPERPVVKASRKKVRKPEEQVASLRKFIFWQSIVMFVLIAALAVAIALLVQSGASFNLLQI